MSFIVRTLLICALFYPLYTGNANIIPPVCLKRVSISADKDMNLNRVVVVHLVVPKTQGLYEEILKKDAQAYFSSVDDLLRDYPNDIEIFKWEIVPGMTKNDIEIKLKDFKGRGVIVFARYSGDFTGVHRIVLPKKRAVKILLTRTKEQLAKD